MTTTAPRTPRARGIHPKRPGLQHSPREKSSTLLPEYLEAGEVRAIMQAAPHSRAKLLILTQWRAGLRVSEALALTRAELSLDTDQPTIRVRNGKRRKARVVPVHPELQNALTSVLEFTALGDGRIIDADRSTAWRWVQEAKKKGRGAGRFGRWPQGRNPHAAPQLRPAPVDARHPAELPQPVDGPHQHQDHAHLPGTGAGPDRKFGGSPLEGV